VSNTPRNVGTLGTLLGPALIAVVLLGRTANGGPAADFLAGAATGIFVVACAAYLYSVGNMLRSSRRDP
jgi:hypothetical protein